MTILAGIIALVVILVCGYFTVKKLRDDQAERAIRNAIASAENKMAHDGIDEDYAQQVVPEDQQARDRGA